MARLILKPGGDRRLRAGHPWIYRAQVADLKGPWSAGAAVDVVDARGQYLGRGFYNPRPALCCRLLTRQDVPVDAGFFLQRLEAAWEYRRAAGLVCDAYRLAWSEADALPGLVVDRYGPVSVVQCLTLGMSRAAGWIAEALGRLFPDGRVCRLDDLTAARIEGFDAIREEEAGELVVTEGPCRFAVRPGAGHKTGLYLDQSENRALAARHAAGRRVLDAFCYGGGFACHALKAGAAQALLLDSSGEALALARRNLELNGVSVQAELREGNAFDLLRQLEAGGERFGLVILDPPPFTRRKDSVDLPLATRSSSSRGFTEPTATCSRSTRGPTRAIRSRGSSRRGLPTGRTRWVSTPLPCARSTGTACESDQSRPSTERRSSTSNRC